MATPHIQISIGGTVLSSFTSFDLNQSMYNHHTFDLVVSHDVVEDLGGHILDKSQKWIGEPFIAEFGENEFHGIVTSVSMDHFAGLNGNLIISGASPTILLEAGPNKQSWNDKTLKNIVEAVVAEAGLEAKVNPVQTESTVYMAQYRESHYGFLQRLAGTFHEWLYYDGKSLFFGKPEPADPIDVVYGTDLENIQISMRMAPLNAKGFSYNSLQDENLDASAPGSVAGLNVLGNEAMSASLDKYGIEPQSSVLPRVTDKSQLETVLKNRQAAAAAGLTSIVGRGKKMELKPGAVAKIDAAVRQGNAWEMKPYGNYLILSISHHITGNYEYYNHFEAIPAELEVLPTPAFQFPIAEPQLANVLSNADPENKGRVEVQFLWQSGDMKSDWIRVMTPDAGTSGEVPANRGMVTIPEEGDQVMVGFRYNDPMRPFVLGSMFHGKSGGGGGQGNKTKSLSTRSGCTVSLDDSKGSITISDPSGNIIIMDGDGKISITAPKELSLSSPKISIVGDETVYIKGVNEVKVESDTIIETADTSFEIISKKNLKVESTSKEEHHGSFDLKADTTVDINGTTMTNVKGGMVNLN